MRTRSTAVNCNGSGYVPIGVPLQNALGIENWPLEVADELNRVHPKGNRFIPEDEVLIAGLNGEPLINPWEALGDSFFLLTREQALIKSLDHDPSDEAADKFLQEAELKEQKNELVCEPDDHPQVDMEDAQQHIRQTYPWMFNIGSREQIYADGTDDAAGMRVSFHGSTLPHRQPGAHKHRFIGFKPVPKRYRRNSIRTWHLDRMTELTDLLIPVVEMERLNHFNKLADRRMRTII